MTLGQKQRAFPLMVAKLIEFTYANGFEVTFGDAYRDPRLHGTVGVKLGYGHSKSAHKQRLAVDLNLFKDGVYLVDTAAYEPLGVFWESIGGSWGGRFADGNHFSVEYGGVR